MNCSFPLEDTVGHTGLPELSLAPSAGDLVDSLAARLAREAGILVRIMRTQGSAPREAGTCMGVFASGVVGTIGGGHLEHQTLALARRMLNDPTLEPGEQRLALGPSLGQCCGGVVHLRLERWGPHNAPELHTHLQTRLNAVALFGGGHVGHALVRLLLTLPYAIDWVDSREGVFPPGLPARVRCEQCDPVQDAVRDLAPGSQVLIMSFSHAEDLDIVAACLKRQRERADLPFIGLIGSRTKWATFRHRLQARGFSEDELAQVTCPIGLPGICGKEPEVIAVAVAAQLLMQRG